MNPVTSHLFSQTNRQDSLETEKCHGFLKVTITTKWWLELVKTEQTAAPSPLLHPIGDWLSQPLLTAWMEQWGSMLWEGGLMAVLC